uniref:VWFC domain-containing protein n=1 Tax=Anopheles maculatus TaxID=74869 RepID=A0A182TA32_9DIPT
FTTPATFQCASIDCAEFLDAGSEDCIHQYSLHGCCAENTVCGKEKLAKLAQCYLDDKMYYEGQRMYPADEPCRTCQCKPGFDNSTIVDNPNCYEIQCGLELHAGDRLAMGCIPIYFGNHRCCPISWKCPSDSDEVIVEGRTEQTEVQEPNMQCKFGKLTLNKGDGITSDNKCVDCKCTVPPLAHCIQRADC